MNQRARLMGAIAIAALAGCSGPSGDAGDEPTSESEQAASEANGQALNGRSLNGRSLNGRSLNGRSLNGVSLGGVLIDGRYAAGVELRKTRFHWVDDDDDDDGGAGGNFVGAVFAGVLDDQTSIPVRIDALAGKDSAGDTLYRASYLTLDGWRPLCGADATGSPIPAVPLEGRWDYRAGVAGGGSKIDDPTAFTFACQGFALAKCADLGYQPFRTVNVCLPGKGCSKVSLAPYHQACTRALRADYCGDGTSFTVNGTLINVYDGAGVQDDTESWPVEAEWTEAGARCMARTRVAAQGTPPCALALSRPDCGDKASFRTGTRLISEDAP